MEQPTEKKPISTLASISMQIKEWQKESPRTKLLVFADGSCLDNGKQKSAWGAAAVYFDEKNVEHSMSTGGGLGTNNVGELAGVLVALRLLETQHRISSSRITELHILTDSRYVQGQLDRGHRTNCNRELVATLKAERERLTAHYQLDRIYIDWVPGHSGLHGNTRVDAIAKWEARQQQTTNSKLKGEATIDNKKIKREKHS